MTTLESKNIDALNINFMKANEENVFITPDPLKPDITGYIMKSQDENGRSEWEEGPILNNRLFTVEATPIITSVNIEYTPAQLFGGLIQREPTANNSNDTFPTAASLASYIRSLGHELEVGTAFRFTISNANSNFYKIIAVENTGITFEGTFAQFGNNVFYGSTTFKLIFTNVTVGAEEAFVLNIFF